jgi:hypothetical protein
VGTVAVCATLRHSARVATRKLRTADYSEEARQRLGTAVAAAREAAGHRWRPSFAKAAGISTRSLTALEIGEPTVGKTALIAVGRALADQGWDEETPRAILEGGPTPPLRHVSAEAPRVDVVTPDEKIRQHFRELWDASPDEETFYRVLAEELAKVRAARGNDTPSVRPTAEG